MDIIKTKLKFKTFCQKIKQKELTKMLRSKKEKEKGKNLNRPSYVAYMAPWRTVSGALY